LTDIWQTILELFGVLAVAALVAWFSRRHVSHERLIADNGAQQVFISIVAATYGILLALVFVGQVSNRNDASAIVAHESSNLLTLFQMTESLPDPAAKLRLRTLIRDAAQSVVRDEWPLMQTGDVKHLILHSPALSAVWGGILTLNFADPRTKAIADEAIRVCRDLNDSRRLRLLHAEDAVPPVMWVVLAAGGVFLLIHAYLVGVQTRWLHMLLTATSIGLVFILLRLIYHYQQPYEGPFSVQPEPFVLALRRIQEAFQ
jgi:hypothetical protein